MAPVICKRLSNGVLMPALNLGTYRLGEETAPAAIKAAFAAGYRGFDCARFYANEHILGPLIAETERDYGSADNKCVCSSPKDVGHIPAGFEAVADFADTLPKERFKKNQVAFITTKIWPTDFGKINEVVDAHLKDMGRDNIDLLLMHWPGPHHTFEGCTEAMQKDETSNSARRIAVWKQLETFYKNGKARAIGVSNFMPQHLEPLMNDIAHRAAAGDSLATPVMINQVEGSPWIQGFKDLEKYCVDHKIAIACYRPLGGDSVKYGRILEEDVSSDIAKSHKKPKANVLVRWGLEQGFIVIPKSANPDRIVENRDVFSFELSEADMKRLDDLFVAKASSVQNPYDIA